MALPPMHALSLRAARAPVGAAAGTANGGAAGTAVFDNKDLLNLILPNILHELYDNADPERACLDAARWCAVNGPGSCADKEPEWTRLTEKVFGPGAPDLVPGGTAQRNFNALCGRTAAYRRGQRRLHDHPLDRAVHCFVLAAVTQDGLALEYAEGGLRSDPAIVHAAS